VPVQLRFATELTGEEYVSAQAWQQASLDQCPLHEGGGCRFSRHGSYERGTPPGARVARWYCRDAHCTFSLLPDCLASRLAGTLEEVEEVVAQIDQAPSLEKAADIIRKDDIFLPGALRWLRRRRALVRAVLLALLGLMPDLLVGSQATIGDFRRVFDASPVLPGRREKCAEELSWLPPPLGFGPRPKMRPPPRKRSNTTRGRSPGSG